MSEYSEIEFSELLALCGKGMANSLGYVRFEDLVKNSSYFRVDLTNNKILCMHLRDCFGSEFYGQLYDETITKILKKKLDHDNTNAAWEFYQRENLLNIAREKVFDTIVYRCFDDHKVGWRQTCVEFEVRDGNVLALFLVIDATFFHSHLEIITWMAERDFLSGLFNRYVMVESITQYLDIYTDESCAIVVLDIDNFKFFNDRFGHAVGDAVIKDVAAILLANFRNIGLVGRNGGDEFLMMIHGKSQSEVHAILESFLTSNQFSIDVDGDLIPYTLSVGYSMYPSDGLTYEELFHKADRAMYSVKMGGKNSFAQYTDEMAQQNVEQLGFNLMDIITGIPGAVLVYRAKRDNEEILYASKELIDIYECENLDDFLKYTDRKFMSLVHPDDYADVERSIWQQVENSGNNSDYVKYRIITKKGNVKWVDDIGRLVYSDHYGEVFYVFIHDAEYRGRFKKD